MDDMIKIYLLGS